MKRDPEPQAPGLVVVCGVSWVTYLLAHRSARGGPGKERIPEIGAVTHGEECTGRLDTPQAGAQPSRISTAAAARMGASGSKAANRPSLVWPAAYLA